MIGSSRWLRGVLVIAVLVAIHAAWDYVEARRLSSRLDALRRAGSPTSSSEIEPRARLEREENGAAYYRAAAALMATPTGEVLSLLRPVSDALESGEWPDGLAARLETAIDAASEILDLLDRATPLGYSAPRLPDGFLELRRLAGLRTVAEALSGDAAAATKALLAELRMGGPGRPYSTRGDAFELLVPTIWNLEFVLARTDPDDTQLRAIAVALDDLRRENALVDFWESRRALMIEDVLRQGLGGSAYLSPAGFGLLGFDGGGRATFVTRLFRPLTANRLNGGLDDFETLLEVSRRPWPDRLDAVGRADVSWLALPRETAEVTAEFAGREARLDAARAMVAVERYRRVEGAPPDRLRTLVPRFLDRVPVDPFTGDPLRFAAGDTGYVVYSVGPNRTDEQGALGPASEFENPPRPQDVGVRVRR